MSPDVSNPAAREITYDELFTDVCEQVDGLIEGGADVILIETIFDTLNAKAAIFACMEVFEETGKELPVSISGTITDASGRTLSGQTIEAFYTSIKHVNPLSVGINCALGASAMRPYIESLADNASCYVSCYPNAGLPNEFGEYDETPHTMCVQIDDFLESGFINIIGGCCGTTPDHIREIAAHAKNHKPRPIHKAATA